MVEPDRQQYRPRRQEQLHPWALESDFQIGLGFSKLADTRERGNTSGCLDPGYPLPGKLRQAQFVLPKETTFAGLKLRVELEVKGMRYPVQWACRQKLNEDGSLTLRSNLHHGF